MKNSTLTLFVLALLISTFSNAQLSQSPNSQGGPSTEFQAGFLPIENVGTTGLPERSDGVIGVERTSEGARLYTAFQKLEATVSKNGLHVNSLSDAGGSLHLVATSFGRNGKQTELAAQGHVSIEGGVVRYVRPYLTEEYGVTMDGVRQDFVLAERPSGEGDLLVHLSLHGAKAESAPVGACLTLLGTERKLVYSRLRVLDARGNEIVASLNVLAEDMMVVRVRDAEAQYPLRIDPTFSDANWVNIGSSLDQGVFAFATIGSDVYVGGSFTTVGVPNSSYIAKWDGTSWSALGTGMNNSVLALAVIGTDLYAAGNFTTAGGVTANRIARWDGSSWNSLGVGTGNGVNNSVRALAVLGTDLYVGGLFTAAGGVAVNRGHFVKWDGSAWSNIISGMPSLVRALAVVGSEVYIGGDFNGGTLNYIAKWTGTTYVGLNSGLNNRVSALTVIGSDLYVGGDFTGDAFNGTALNRIAKWDGGTWSGSALGAGMNAPVYSLTTDGTDLYAGGAFTLAGGTGANRIALWNGSNWSALGSGMDNTVYSLKVSGDDLFVGGLFLNAGGTAAPYIAKGLIGPDSDGDGVVDALDVCPLAVDGIPDFDENTCACTLGYFATITDINGNDVITACTICPPGSYCADGIDTFPCPAGTFSDQPGLSACTPCTPGYANYSLGQTSCQACPPGRFSDVQAATVCSLCPANTYNPSEAQTECTACPSGESSAAGSVACIPDGNTTDVTLELRTPDGSSDEISWEIVDLSNTVVCDGGSYPGNITDPFTDFCTLPNGCYRLRVYDIEGDGFGVGGGYQLRLAGPDPQDIRMIDNLGNFTTGSLSAIGSGPFGGPSAFCVPIAENPKPLYHLRDKLDFVNGTYLVCEEDAAVSAEWQVGTQTDDGYEFWLFDPNGSYSYRRFRNHATSDGFANVGAIRACHMRVNGWFASQHAPANVLLNVRIRTRVNGLNSPFGPAYRFKIDPARAACPLTMLNDFPGNQFESCNKTRNWGGSNLIHARPVSGANRYQWRFQNVNENLPPVIRTNNTYFLPLNWTGNPLTPGQYSVDVRASKNGGASWCVDAVVPALDEWGTVCLLTIVSSQAQGGGENLALESTNMNLSLYPNPNRGDQVWLSIDMVDKGVETISVDFFDLAGHRAFARTIPTQGKNLNSLLELNGLAAGVYIVHITAGEKVYTERLVIAQ